MSNAPAFQFYPADYLADEKVQCLTSAQEGIFWRLTCYCWREGSLPRDTAAVLALCKRDADPDDVSTVVQRMFSVSSTDAQRLTSKRLEIERAKQEQRRQQTREAGLMSAKARASARQRAFNERCNSVPTKSNPSSSSSSSFGGEGTAVEFPAGFPATEADALTCIQGIPEEFAKMVYHECAGRNGMDCFGKPVSRWANYLKARFIKEQGRVEERKQYRPNGRRAPSPAVPILDVKTLIP